MHGIGIGCGMVVQFILYLYGIMAIGLTSNWIMYVGYRIGMGGLMVQVTGSRAIACYFIHIYSN
jgi:hypothetical protein